MMHRWTKASLFSVTLTFLLTTPCWPIQSAEPTQSGTKRALLIGINRYQVLPSLNGSLNDIETMRQVLTTRWGFQSHHVTMLTDQAATRAGMLAAFEKLAKETGPEDVVYVHYSGHGSQVEDFSGDETDDHLDETLVPHDGRTAKVPDITDDELDEIFSRLNARSVLIVLDSCHSGTATRSLDIRTRSVPKDTRVELYHPSTVRTRQVVPVMASRYVLMSGAAANQEALDGPVQGRYHGFFSYSLAKSFGAAGVSATPREIFAGVEREMRRIQIHFGRTSMPEPQLEAPPTLLDAPLIPSIAESKIPQQPQASARLPWVEVRAAGSNEFFLTNGPLLGASPGSTWTVYPPNETTFAPGRALGVLVVIQSRDKDAVAKPQGSSFTIPPAARAVAFLPAPPPERIPITLLNVPDDRRGNIEQMLRQYGRGAQIVEAGRPAKYLVDVKDDQLQLYSADGLQVVGTFSLDNPQWGAGLALVLTRSANASELLTLDNPSSQMKVDVRIAGAPRRATRGIAVIADTQPAQYHIRHDGEPRNASNSLQLEVQVTTDSYLTIVDVDSEGHLNLLFPNNHQQPTFYPEGRVRNGELVTIPDSLQNGNHAGFHWDYAPPQGTDTIRVFASTDLETAQAIRQRILAIPAPGASGIPVATSPAPVPTEVKHLRHDLAKVATRGLSSVYDTTPAALTTPTPARPSPQAVTPPVSAAPQEAPHSATSSSGLVHPATQTVPAAASADWAAASLTIQVEP